MRTWTFRAKHKIQLSVAHSKLLVGCLFLSLASDFYLRCMVNNLSIVSCLQPMNMFICIGWVLCSVGEHGRARHISLNYSMGVNVNRCHCLINLIFSSVYYIQIDTTNVPSLPHYMHATATQYRCTIIKSYSGSRIIHSQPPTPILLILWSSSLCSVEIQTNYIITN